jgi:hypothetical protein
MQARTDSKAMLGRLFDAFAVYINENTKKTTQLLLSKCWVVFLVKVLCLSAKTPKVDPTCWVVSQANNQRK